MDQVTARGGTILWVLMDGADCTTCRIGWSSIFTFCDGSVSLRVDTTQIEKSPKFHPPRIERASWYHSHHAAYNKNLVGLLVFFKLAIGIAHRQHTFLFLFSLCPLSNFILHSLLARYSPLSFIDHLRSTPVSTRGFLFDFVCSCLPVLFFVLTFLTCSGVRLFFSFFFKNFAIWRLRPTAWNLQWLVDWYANRTSKRNRPNCSHSKRVERRKKPKKIVAILCPFILPACDLFSDYHSEFCFIQHSRRWTGRVDRTRCKISKKIWRTVICWRNHLSVWPRWLVVTGGDPRIR